MKRPVPDELAPLFHNYDPSSIDLDRHAGLVIRTVLAEGTWEQVLWLFREYGWDRVRQVVLADHRGLRTLPEPTRRLWLAVFSDRGDTHAAGDDSQDPLERWRCRRIPPGPGDLAALPHPQAHQARSRKPPCARDLDV